MASLTHWSDQLLQAVYSLMLRYGFLFALGLLAACTPTPTRSVGNGPPPILTATLDSLRQADQQDRQTIFAVFRQHGFRSVAADTANRWLLRRDSVRLHKFQQLEQRLGWQVLAQAEPKASFLLLQHAPDSMQVRYLPKVQDLYDAGQLHPASYATYLDRALMNQGQPQRYGTQFGRIVRASGLEIDSLFTTADLQNVDQRRRQMKLEPLLPRLEPGTTYFKKAP
ncbi:DUF6624 domain-containing protein [Hymenobacter terrestris]|uniref:Uncharacterized protein n=1 Tax=Hymenobacter terrestris TaxID=2748310 RepID=A0ABX2PZX8_9BACT|nr:DUF6624 domain-containing protein [Hymenobacter terrestris]NVO83859.1 hypothetical protein [Hymenobacter terrestris]